METERQRQYVRDIDQAKQQGREIGIEQLRFMSDALTSLAKAERQVDHERAVDQRRELGLKYRENRNLERYLESRVTDAHAARMTPIDIVTLELVERERTEITNTAAAVQERIDRERAQGREARENSGRPWT